MRSLPLILCLLLYLPADCAESTSCAERAWAALEHPTKLPQQLAPCPQPQRFEEVSSCHSSSNLHVTGVECNFCGTSAFDISCEALTAATCCRCMAHRKRHTRSPLRRVLLQSYPHHCLVQESSCYSSGNIQT